MSADEPATSLTMEMLRATIEKIQNAPRRICGVTEPHVLHPKDYERGRGVCGMCGQWTERPASDLSPETQR